MICLCLSVMPLLGNTVPSRLPRGRAANVGAEITRVKPETTTNQPAAITTYTDFGRYSVILARKPFGDEAAAAAAVAAAAAAVALPPAESFTKGLKMCAITRNQFNGRVQIGIMNVTTKKNYFLYEGDSEDGMELVKADFENEKALLRKGVEEAWMDMNAATVVVAAALPVAHAAGVISARRNSVSAPPPPPPKPLYTGEALEKHLKDYQMELIRAGGEKGPPLPMELTPEMDAKLVEEGVLAPAE